MPFRRPRGGTACRPFVFNRILPRPPSTNAPAAHSDACRVCARVVLPVSKAALLREPPLLVRPEIAIEKKARRARGRYRYRSPLRASFSRVSPAALSNLERAAAPTKRSIHWTAPNDLCSAPIAGWTAPNDLWSAPNDLCSAPNDLCSAPNDLCSAPNELCSAPNELCSAPNDLWAAPNDLCSAPNDLCSAPNDLCSAPNDLCSAPNELWSLRTNFGRSERSDLTP